MVVLVTIGSSSITSGVEVACSSVVSACPVPSELCEDWFGVDENETFTDVIYPRTPFPTGDHTETYAKDINNMGEFVGFYYAGHNWGDEEGFIFDGINYQYIRYPHPDGHTYQRPSWPHLHLRY